MSPTEFNEDRIMDAVMDNFCDEYQIMDAMTEEAREAASFQIAWSRFIKHVCRDIEHIIVDQEGEPLTDAQRRIMGRR